MASGRPPGGQTGGAPTARIGIDLSAMRAAVGVARESGRATAREISQAFKTIQGEQRVALEQARQTTVALRAQQTQISAVTRAESSVRISAARAEAQAQQQATRVAAATAIEEQRRITATHRAEVRAREAATRAARPAAGLGVPLGGSALGALGRGAGTVAGAFGIGLGVVGAVQAGRAAIEAEAVATAYARQNVAAVALAGSQEKLNDLLAVYDKATGGAINRATAMAQVTRLQAVGFADSTQELERFVTASRGASLAMGSTTDYILSQMQLAIANQSTMRLDQIGVGVSEFNERMGELKVSMRGASEEMIYQEALLSLMEQKFGALAASAAAQATGVERLARAWADFRLEAGQVAQGPAGRLGEALAQDLDILTEAIERNRKARAEAATGIVPGGVTMQTNRAGIESMLAGLRAQRERVLTDRESGDRTVAATTADLAELDSKIRAASISLAGLASSAALAKGNVPGAPPWLASVNAAQGGAASRFSSEQLAAQETAMVDRYNALNQITRDANRSILDSERQGAAQRASTIANYNKQAAREAEDFGRQRLNAERKHNLALLDVAQDSARQRAKWEADLERTLQEQRADRDERVAAARADSAARLTDIEEKYNREREKRQRAFAESIRQAAANLDAVQVRELQRQRREENKEAKEAHQEQVADEAESLQERIDEANQAYAEQEQQQRDSLQRRIDEQRENDALRIEEMKAAFEEQKAQEDIERGIRLGRQAEDHAAQLGEMARQQGERIQQIRLQEAEARQQVNEEHQARLADAGLQTDAWLRQQELLVDAAVASHRRFWEDLTRPQLNAMGTPAGFPSLTNPYQYVPPVPIVPSAGTSGGSSRNVSIGDVTVNVMGSTGMGPRDLHDVVYGAVADILEDHVNG